jgi:ubiquinone biosynthesis protein
MFGIIGTSGQDLSRLRQIAGILARHGYAHLAENIRTGRDRADEAAVDEARAALGAPVRLRMLLQELGPTFVKLGQVLSSRPDLVPTEFQVELAQLQDNVGALPVEAIRAQLAAAWRCDPAEHLAYFDERPLATASIAQVHRARLHDGREVVVKVQRPGLEPTIRADLDLLYLLARLLEATIEEAGLYQPYEVIAAFERAILEELDFTIEARNGRAFAAHFAANERLVVPEIVTELSGRVVLVMEFIQGTKITNVDRSVIDVEEVLHVVLDAAFQMAFVDGLFHGDPHPGNILVTPEGKVCLLDYGLVGRLTSNMQQTIIQLSLAIATRDAEAVTRLVYRIGQPEERMSLAAFRDRVSDMMARYLLRSLDEVDAASLLNELLDLALKYKIRVPADYALLAKSAVTIEGIIRQLAPKLDIARTILPYAQRLMADRYSPEAVGRLALRSAVTLLDSAQQMPLIAHQIVTDLESGRLTVRVSNPELDRMSRSLNDLGTKVFLGMVTMALILGTFFVLARYPWEWHGVNIWAVIGSAISLWIVFMVVSWHFLYTRLKKISARAVFRMFGGGARRRPGDHGRMPGP